MAFPPGLALKLFAAYAARLAMLLGSERLVQRKIVIALKVLIANAAVIVQLTVLLVLLHLTLLVERGIAFGIRAFEPLDGLQQCRHDGL